MMLSWAMVRVRVTRRGNRNSHVDMTLDVERRDEVGESDCDLRGIVTSLPMCRVVRSAHLSL